MKRDDLVRHLEDNGCELLREGGRHSVYVNRATRKASALPRHREINEHPARKICRDLEVPRVEARRQAATHTHGLSRSPLQRG